MTITSRPGVAARTLPDVPPRNGEIIELAIDGLADGGQGIGRVDDFVVSSAAPCPATACGPGRQAQARLRRARLLEIVTASSLRVPPTCGHEAGRGGCEWQTLDDAARARIQQRQVVESLQQIGGRKGSRVEPIRGMEHPCATATRRSTPSAATKVAAGRRLHRRGSWREIIEVEDCWLAPLEVTGRGRRWPPPAAPSASSPYSAAHSRGAAAPPGRAQRVRERRAAPEPLRERAFPAGGGAGGARRRAPRARRSP